MKKQFVRLVALLLVFALGIASAPFAAAAPAPLPSLIPTSVYDQLDPLWDAVAEAETNALSIQGVQSLQNVDLSAIAQAVTESDLYVDGSLRWQGRRFTFDTTVGIPCAYSPRLRQQARTSVKSDLPESQSEIQTISYDTDSTENPGVYVIGPYYGLDSSFTNQYQSEAKSIAQALGTTYTLYQKTAATVDRIADAIESGAVVFFDSHGDTDYANPYDENDFVTGATTSYLCLQSGEGLTSADYANNHAYYGGSYYSMQYYEVDGTVIANHMDRDAGDCFLWMAICLGMATDGLQKPLRSRGVDVVYGYSQSVTFDGDYLFEGTFWDEMEKGVTVAEAIATMKDQWGCWDCSPQIGEFYGYASYEVCSTLAEAREYYCAFPIVVSDQDAYPGHGKVDNYQTVHSDYTLLDQYHITARSSDETKGTVSLSGSTVTAVPAEGCYAAGYTLEPADAAQVTQRGNTFTLSNMTADCTITIRFESKTPASVHFDVPEGVSQADISSYLGDAITLPTPSGTPADTSRSFTFVGWSAEPVADTTERPAFYPAGSSYTVTGSDTLYAVYTYSVAGGTSNIFTLVNAARDNWAAEYVITRSSGAEYRALLADGSCTSFDIGSTSAAVLWETAGLSADGTVLQGVTDDYTFIVAPAGSANAYTIRMKGSDDYLACTSTSNKGFSTTKDPSSTQAHWTISYGSNEISICSVAYPSRALRYNNGSKIFRCYTEGNQKALTLYASSAQTIHYTTQLGSHTHSYVDTVTAPTCTEQGYTTHTCACGESFVDTYVPALGHDYGEWTQTKAPTCTETGEEKRTCSRCDAFETKDLAALGHAVVVDPAAAATCTETGLTEGKHCSRCNVVLVKQETVPALGHDWNNGVVTKEPTETETGIKTFSCRRCDATRTETIPTLGHTHSYVATVTAPTCTDKGYTTHTCDCGDSYVDAYVDALGHDFVDWVSVTEATCTEKGKESRYCACCGLTETRELPAVGHELSDWVFTQLPSCTQSGTETRTCAHCGLTETREVDVLGHDWVYTFNFNGDSLCISGLSYVRTCNRCGLKESLPQQPCSSAQFDDVKMVWYHTAVDYMTAFGLMNGVSATRFGVNDNMTRGMLVTILYRAAGEPDVSSVQIPFTDVADGTYYTDAVKWAYQNGIVKGISATAFAPNRDITRQELVTILYRRYASPPKKNGSSLDAFPDHDQVSDFACNAMKWAVAHNIVNGVSVAGSTYLQPKATATRAQCAQILYRIWNRYL